MPNTELEAIRLLVVKELETVFVLQKTALGLVEIEPNYLEKNWFFKRNYIFTIWWIKEDLFDISTDYNVMKITDIQNEIDYEIDMDLVYNGKIVGYLAE